MDDGILELATTMKKTIAAGEVSLGDGETINRLRTELESLQLEYRRLQAKIENAEALLIDQKEENVELKKMRLALSEEIMELTKALFEEANGMVAEEAKARAKLEITRRKLESELETTKEQLRLEKQQLFELRDRFADRRGETSHCNAAFSKETLANSLEHQYFPCLLPKHRVNSRLKCTSASGEIWDKISRRFETEDLREFTKFVEKMADFDAETMMNHPFLKRICETDVVSCLNFEFKPRPFVKKLALSMLKNTCSIERTCRNRSPGSPNETSDTASDTIVVDLQMIDIDYSPVLEAGSPVRGGGGERLRGIMSHFTTSVSSLPETLLATYNPSVVSSTNEPKPKYCSLCGRNEVLGYRFRISDIDAWNSIDKYCQQKLVAAGHFFTFLRHLKSGLHSNRPILDLYYDLLHYRRLMFYTRVDRGATMFYLQSDYEAFLDIIENQLRGDVAGCKPFERNVGSNHHTGKG